MSETKALTVRMNAQLADRIDVLVDWMATQPEMSLAGRPSRSDAIRYALLAGVEVLEARAAEDKAK